MFSGPFAVQSVHNMTSLFYYFSLLFTQWDFEIFVLFHFNFYINIALAGGLFTS